MVSHQDIAEEVDKYILKFLKHRVGKHHRENIRMIIQYEKTYTEMFIEKGI